MSDASDHTYQNLDCHEHLSESFLHRFSLMICLILVSSSEEQHVQDKTPTTQPQIGRNLYQCESKVHNKIRSIRDGYYFLSIQQTLAVTSITEGHWIKTAVMTTLKFDPEWCMKCEKLCLGHWDPERERNVGNHCVLSLSGVHIFIFATTDSWRICEQLLPQDLDASALNEPNKNNWNKC